MSATTEGIAPNAKRLLFAGFMAILAAGVGYSVRGGILKLWANEFGFTMTELGNISGGGLTGFGIVIIFGALLADKLGYGKLMVTAFVLHFISAVVTLAAPWVFHTWGKAAAYDCLFWGMFIFAIGNGLAEAVVNPLTATLFPKNKTHYLNILHAGWPAGLVLGSVASAFMSEKVDDAGAVISAAVDWKIQISLFIVPVVIYGAMLIGQRFPKSEASQAGVSFGEMLGTIFAPLMILLLITQALVGYVELGTDSWIGKITGTIMSDPMKGLLLFSYTSMLMFVLRFFAGPIVHRISPLGLLFAGACLGATGLTLLGNATTVMMCIVAATVYALGKTFLWPTMLAVVSERFPKGGAVAIGMLGAAGMLSAGLIGTPAIGFKQDKYASAKLKEISADTYGRYVARDKTGKPDEKKFFWFKTEGLDGAKVGTLDDGGKELARVTKLIADGKEKPSDDHTALVGWWKTAEKYATSADDKTAKKAGKEVPKRDNDYVNAANMYGGQSALRLTAYVPMILAVIYLLLILGFKAKGGYKALSVSEEKAEEGH